MSRADGVKDLMWAMFQRGHQRANLKELEDDVNRLIRMASQKTAGQRGKPGDIDWNTLDMELMRIAIEASCFVLDERFPDLRDKWEKEDGDKDTNN